MSIVAVNVDTHNERHKGDTVAYQVRHQGNREVGIHEQNSLISADFWCLEIFIIVMLEEGKTLRQGDRWGRENPLMTAGGTFPNVAVGSHSGWGAA